MGKWFSTLFILLFLFHFANFVLALDPPSYLDDKTKFINDDDYVSREEMFSSDDTTLSGVPESYVVELQDYAKDQMENVMKNTDSNEDSIGFPVATTPPSIYDFQGDYAFHFLLEGGDYSCSQRKPRALLEANCGKCKVVSLSLRIRSRFELEIIQIVAVDNTKSAFSELFLFSLLNQPSSEEFI